MLYIGLKREHVTEICWARKDWFEVKDYHITTISALLTLKPTTEVAFREVLECTGDTQKCHLTGALPSVHFNGRHQVFRNGFGGPY